MNISRLISAPVPKAWQLLRLAPLVIAIYIYTAKAGRENAAAGRQQTSFGTITDCNHSGKQNFCRYSFSVDERWYTGGSTVADRVYFGQVKVVYYDSQNPAINGLQDLSEAGRKDRNIAFMLLFVVAAVVAFALYSI